MSHPDKGSKARRRTRRTDERNIVPPPVGGFYVTVAGDVVRHASGDWDPSAELRASRWARADALRERGTAALTEGEARRLSEAVSNGFRVVVGRVTHAGTIPAWVERIGDASPNGLIEAHASVKQRERAHRARGLPVLDEREARALARSIERASRRESARRHRFSRHYM